MKKILGKITSNSIAFIVTFCAIGFGAFTYFKFLSSDQLSQDIQTVYLLLIIDLLLLLSLAFILGYKLMCIVIETRKKKAGAKLQRRLIKLFTLLLTVPFTLICISYVFSSYLGMQAWFSDRVKTAISESVYVSEAYLEEHNKVVKSDVLNLGNIIGRVPLSVYNNKDLFSEFLGSKSMEMDLPEIVVFDSSGRVVGETDLSLSFDFDPFSNIDELNLARDGEVVIIPDEYDDRIFALVKLDGFIETFLLVGKFADTNVLQHVQTSKDGAKAYFDLEKKINKMQITFICVFAMFAMILLFVSIWIAFIFADKISAPIVSLIKASRSVGAGKLNIKLEEDKSSGEINDLIKAFNLMTHKLEEQQNELMKANKDLDDRRFFMESVLAGVSSGVLGLNHNLKITLANKSAQEILQLSESALVHKDISKIIPEISEMFDNKIDHRQIEIDFEDSVSKIIMLNITKQENKNFVVSFRDVTSLIAAQKKAAWGDVARRIAHEIKNPLTPIALSAERMSRKFKDEIKDKEVFNRCTSTILRQVHSLGSMINEFSSFARMPDPIFAEANLTQLIKSTVIAFKEGDIDVTFKGLSKEVICNCDEDQISRAVANVFKNALEALDGRKDKKIKISLSKENKNVSISIEDNGMGIDMDKSIAEPYITTKKKGTGLGLAIVKKIMEDHSGNLKFRNKKSGGAVVTLSFKCRGDE